MATRLYRWLVRLHPSAFRERFGAEMLCLYDEADPGEWPRLVADRVVSLARQWVVGDDGLAQAVKEVRMHLAPAKGGSVMATRLYRRLVRLHPSVFRERFGAEMLCL